ncbi:MAG: SusD/RagB family nutrient-binding outer membrane lipoprotein, partial [Ginsengibacter sp.]
NALQKIMEEKSIADFLSVENYNDWRRTGFPKLNLAANPQAGVTAIPRRYPYSAQEISTNPQPQNANVKITDRVWWDTP